MKSENHENKKYDLQVEKIIARSAPEVFRAIGEGRLFLNCSGGSETLKVDFKVGGKYHIDFMGHNMSNHGEFLEIIPNKKIVFTWCQNPLENNTPDTIVTIQLEDLGAKTQLTLKHAGFRDQDRREMHSGGWNSGLDDLAAEITQGRLRFMRFFDRAAAAVYAKCKEPASFFGRLGDLSKGTVDFKVGGRFQLPTKNGEIKGRFLEIIPNQKISFTWEAICGEPANLDTKVTLNFEVEDEKESWLELIHEGLDSESKQKRCREGWDWLLNQLAALT